MSLVPLPERGGVHLDDAALDESLRTDQLIVTGVVDDIDDTGSFVSHLTKQRINSVSNREGCVHYQTFKLLTKLLII